jgi:hypothetical protein
MELAPTVISAGYASGLNAYGTVFMLGLLGRTGFGEVPHELTTGPILIAAGVRPQAAATHNRSGLRP